MAAIVNDTEIIFKEDITRKINTDFGEYSDNAFETLKSAVEKIEYLKTDRVIRCIIFLSEGNIDDLNKFIETATNDTRDIMLWAEYEKINNDTNFKRIRDFNNTFEESANNVKE